MKRLLALLLAMLASTAFGQVNLGSPVPLPPATQLATNPHFAAMQKQSRESGRDVYMRLHEQGSPAPRWFKCDPQGWISYGDPPGGAEPAQPVQQVTYQPAPRREVAQPARATFRGGEPYDPDHQCDRCGTSQFAIERFNGDGTHSHVCRRCGHSWRHR